MAANSITKINKFLAKNGKTLNAAIVTHGPGWNRPPGYPSESVREDFTKTAADYEGYPESTNTVALQETEHQSEADKRDHYTALLFNKSDKLTATIHLVKKKKEEDNKKD